MEHELNNQQATERLSTGFPFWSTVSGPQVCMTDQRTGANCTAGLPNKVTSSAHECTHDQTPRAKEDWASWPDVSQEQGHLGWRLHFSPSTHWSAHHLAPTIPRASAAPKLYPSWPQGKTAGETFGGASCAPRNCHHNTWDIAAK
eukprot:CAMPEP_0194492776 /NCGR_PEP_ID=MMETSP0253-20130528/11211_1 /TAXON_ID=2966 /ORGANISM="Noctiluca scintillans" /LENGTH=144 /DNA_ID=CAMNT_0039333683 /DNA_START=1244 /DNA_END=1678 /DNA_ORIENTATION=+